MPPLVRHLTAYIAYVALAAYLGPLLSSVLIGSSEQHRVGNYIAFLCVVVFGAFIGARIGYRESLLYNVSLSMIPAFVILHEFLIVVRDSYTNSPVAYAVKELVSSDCGSSECLYLSSVTLPAISVLAYLASSTWFARIKKRTTQATLVADKEEDSHNL